MDSSLGSYALLPDFVDFMIDLDNAMLAAAAAVSDEEYYKDRGISFGSLHKLLVHAMAAQKIWLIRLTSKGAEHPRRFDHNDFPTRQSLQQHWPEVHAALRAFVHAQTADSLATPVTCKNFKGEPSTLPLGQFLLHVTDHGTYHRGQQNSLLKLAGGMPLDASYYSWRKKQHA